MAEIARDPAEFVCQCAWGNVEDDDGNLVDPCPAGHVDPCTNRAEVRVRLRTGHNNRGEVAYLCRTCADKWTSEEDWTEPGPRKQRERKTRR
ncbi:MAG: hypothetical protein GEU75_17305 [Dehalococcoidia bacterium]|nr:hypothetical protein [Dehalococcoidia bacterium]